MVGQLRAMTGAGLMDCKKALDEAQGNLDTAVDWLRKKGAAAAGKKADRAANEGFIGQAVTTGGRVGVLIEVNCETDFVVRNDSFKSFVGELAAKVAVNPTVDLDGDRVAAAARIGENIQVRRHQRLEVNGVGAVAAYIHTGGKVGVLVEIGATEGRHRCLGRLQAIAPRHHAGHRGRSSRLRWAGRMCLRPSSTRSAKSQPSRMP